MDARVTAETRAGAGDSSVMSNLRGKSVHDSRAGSAAEQDQASSAPVRRTGGPWGVSFDPTWVPVERRFHDVGSPRPQRARERSGEEVLVGLSALPRSAAEREVLGLIVDEIVGVAIGVVPVTRPLVLLRRATIAARTGFRSP